MTFKKLVIYTALGFSGFMIMKRGVAGFADDIGAEVDKMKSFLGFVPASDVAAKGSAVIDRIMSPDLQPIVIPYEDNYEYSQDPLIQWYSEIDPPKDQGFHLTPEELYDLRYESD